LNKTSEKQNSLKLNLNKDEIEGLISSKIIKKPLNNQIKELEISEKWDLVDEGLKKIVKAPNVFRKKFEEYLKEFEKWLPLIKEKYDLIQKNSITIQTEIDENVTLDLIISEIELFYQKLKDEGELKLGKSEKNLICFLKKMLKKDGIRQIVAPLFIDNGDENIEKHNLLKILKIDYFLKDINDKNSNINCLKKILSQKLDDLNCINLFDYYLPFQNESNKLISYGDFIQTILESTAYLSAIVFLMNFQSKEKQFTQNEIKQSIRLIYDNIFHPIVFKNKNEDTHLYAITCINLRVYLSSFILKNIQCDVDNINDDSNQVSDLEKLNELKDRILLDVNVGQDFTALIVTILHETCHILRRHIVAPNVYINTEEMEKMVLTDIQTNKTDCNLL
jgi:hypothetical protein